MVLVKVKDFEFYMEGYLKKNLDFIREKVLRNKDQFICVIDGRTGTGKSTLAAQCAYYLTEGNMELGSMNEDKTFNLKSYAWNQKQFNTVMANAQPGSAVMGDEMFGIANTRLSLTRESMEVLARLQTMRSKKVFIFLCLPCIYDLDKNIVLNLADLFIHCHREDYGSRGQYDVYDRSCLVKFWNNAVARKTRTFPPKVAIPNFSGRFTKAFPFNFEEYEKLKQTSQLALPKKNKNNKELLQQRNILAKELYKKKIMTLEQIGNILEIHKGEVCRIINNDLVSSQTSGGAGDESNL